MSTQLTDPTLCPHPSSDSGDDVSAAVRIARTAFDDGPRRFLTPLEQERRPRRLVAPLTRRADPFGPVGVITPWHGPPSVPGSVAVAVAVEDLNVPKYVGKKVNA
jgi:acyl-CoA reductase-like NAD-dependent aldehyde dehydrogenase